MFAGHDVSCPYECKGKAGDAAISAEESGGGGEEFYFEG
jgi:hypothetical protein